MRAVATAKRRSEARVIRAHRRHQVGQAMVEFALTTPVLLLLLAASIDFGMGYSARLEVANAARVGARWASLHSGDVNSGWSPITSPADNTIEGQVLYSGDTRNIVNNNAHIVIKYFVWTPGTTTTTYCGKYDQPTNLFVSANGYTQAQCVAVGNVVQVAVYYDYPLLTPLFASLYGKTISIGSNASFVIQS
jgi:Flp pilus assembly protein TadG